MSIITEQAILWPVIVPLGAAMLAVAFWGRRRAQELISLTGLLGLLASAVLLLLSVSSGGVLTAQFGNWPAPFGIGFAADMLSSVMVLVTALLSLAVGVFGLAGVRDSQARGGFQPLFLGMIAAVNGAFLTADIFNLYVWFELMLMTSTGLVLLDRSRAQLDGAVRYLVLNLFATTLFLVGVALLYGVTGTLNMADMAVTLAVTEASISVVIAGLLFLIAFGIKGAYFPLFFWLPASYHTASITVTAIFAGLLTKVGVYATYRVFMLILSADAPGLKGMIAVIAGGTMLFGVFGAAVQWDTRRILSFHIISQIGYMLFGLAIGSVAAVAGSVFYLVHHMIVKTNLFLVAGAMQASAGSFDLRKSGGLMRSHPLLAALFLIPALSLAGIPPLSGFWAKYLVVDASFRGDQAWLGATGLFVGLMTLYSMSKIWTHGFRKPGRSDRRPKRIPGAMLVASGILGVATLFITFAPEPVFQLADRTADQLASPGTYIHAALPSATGDLP